MSSLADALRGPRRGVEGRALEAWGHVAEARARHGTALRLARAAGDRTVKGAC